MAGQPLIVATLCGTVKVSSHRVLVQLAVPTFVVSSWA